MEKVYPAFDLLSLSSYNEGFPNVVAEAMACGVPVVATEVGETPEIVGNTGDLIPSGDSRALFEAWERFLALPPAARSQRAEKARRHIEANYALESIADRYAGFYRDLMHNG